uniref:Uncharacterized protein n=1 Tax=Eutreptiella gymnastica TaxID=73025 RepID=A0A7S4CZV7_9EUGL
MGCELLTLHTVPLIDSASLCWLAFWPLLAVKALWSQLRTAAPGPASLLIDVHALRRCPGGHGLLNEVVATLQLQLRLGNGSSRLRCVSLAPAAPLQLLQLCPAS